MKTEKTLLILWVIFGFIFIQAIDSILSFFIHLIFFAAVALELSFAILLILIPVLAVLTYLIAALAILKRVKESSETTDILTARLPKNKFFLLLALAITLGPITHKLSGLFFEWTSNNVALHESELLALYGWMNMGVGIGRWLSVIGLGLLYFKKVE